MDIDKISKDDDNKEIISNKEENESFSFDSDIEEKYNKLYSNFDVKEKQYDFWDTFNNKINNKIQESNKLINIHHILEYKNYKIINDSDFPLNNKTNYVNKNRYNPQKNKKGRNKVYNRLYNRGFYVKNKMIINKIKDEENFSKTMSENSYMNPYSKKILLSKNNSSDNKTNKGMNYYKEDETFKPNINKNSIRIVKRLHGNHK